MFGDELTFAAKREHARRIAKTAIEDVHILADIWRKQGIDESIIKDVSENVASAQREAAVAIMSWTVRGFRELDGNVVIPQVLIKSYGKDTVKLIGNAYNLAMRQGHVDPKEFQVYHREMKKIVTKLGKQHESDADMVFDRMTPVAVGRFTAALESDSRGEFMSKIGPIVEVLRCIANNEISPEQDKALDSWFGSRKNDVLDHFYEEKTHPKQDDGECISGLAEDNAFAQREEQGLSDSTEHGFTKVKQETYYQRRDRNAATGEEGEYFDLTNDEHRVKLEEIKAGRVRDAMEEVEAPSLRTMDTVGIVDREIEKRQHQKAIDAAGKRNAVRDYACSIGKAESELLGDELETAKALAPADLTPSERKKVIAESKALHPDEIGKIRRELAEKHLGIKAPKLRAGAGPEETKAYERELRDHDQTLTRALSRLNKSRVAVRVTQSDMPNDLGFTAQEVTDLRLKKIDLRKANALVTNGVLVFDNGSKSGNYYATTARKIIAAVIAKGGDAGFSCSLDELGGMVHRYRLLQDGVVSLLQASGFTRVGYIDRAVPDRKGVKPVWLKKGAKDFPDELPIAKDFRVVNAKTQRSEYDARQEKGAVLDRAILHSESKAMNRLMRMRVRSFILSELELSNASPEMLYEHSAASKALNLQNEAYQQGGYTKERINCVFAKKKKLANDPSVDNTGAIAKLDAEIEKLTKAQSELVSKATTALKAALKELIGSRELHYTTREAGLLVQAGMHIFTAWQVGKVRDLKQGIGRSVKDRQFKAAQDAVLKFFEKDPSAKGLKEGMDDLVEWRERATDFINWKLSSSRLASAAADDFHATGEIEGLRDALYKITGDEHYMQSSVPSENSKTWKPDDAEIMEHGTRRDDPNKTVGMKGTAIQRDERGNFKGDSNYMAGLMTGAGDSSRMVKDAVEGVRAIKSGVVGKAEPGAAIVKKKVPSRGALPMDQVIAWLRASVSNTMANLCEQIENDRLDVAMDAVDRVEDVSKMTAERLIKLAPDLDKTKAGRLIERAKNALPRARAIVDCKGEVGDGRNVENSPQKEVGQGGSGGVREVVDARAVERAGRAADPQALAGEVQRLGREAVADGDQTVQGRRGVDVTSIEGKSGGATGRPSDGAGGIGRTRIEKGMEPRRSQAEDRGGSASSSFRVSEHDLGVRVPDGAGSGEGSARQRNRGARTTPITVQRGVDRAENRSAASQSQEAVAGRLKAVGDWINKALDADPERVAQVVAKMTDSQINATLEVIDSMEMGKIRHLEQLLIENLSDNKQSK